MPEYKVPLHFKCPSDTETVWTQPQLTANGEFSGDSFAVSCSSTIQYSNDYAAWCSFRSTTDYKNCCCSTSGINITEDNPWIYTMYFSNPTKITSISIKNRTVYCQAPALFLFQGSNSDNDGTWVTLTTMTNTNNTAGETWSFSIPTANQGFYRYYRFYIKSIVGLATGSTDTYVSLGFPTITAVEKIATTYEIPLYTLSTDEEVTGKAAPVLMNKNLVYAAYGYSDNTFASAVKCKVPGVTYNSDNKVDLYYKYIYGTWTQPVFTSSTATDGSVVTSSSYLSSDTQAYNLFNGSNTNSWSNGWHKSSSDTSPWMKIKFPYKVKITSIQTYQNNNGSNSDGFCMTGQFFADEAMTIPLTDIVSFTQTAVALNTFTVNSIITDCVYFKMLTYKTYGGLTSIYIIGQKQSSEIVTSSDYDYIVAKNTNLLVNQYPTGTYTFSKTGTYTITFTVPTGVNVLYCSPGTMSTFSPDYQYAYVSSGKYWFYLKQWSEFVSEGGSSLYYTTDEPHYVAVTSGKTYTLSVYISSATTYPTISWSPEINKHTTDVSEL